MTVMRKAAASTIILAPLTAAAADLLRMRAENTGDIGATTEWGAEQVKTQLEAIQANLALYQVASWLALAAAVLTIPAAMQLWSAAVERSRRWAWAGAVLAICCVVGEFVHLMGYYALNQIFVAGDINMGAQIATQADANGFAMALFLPYLLGALLALPVQAIALRRARIIPTWALAAILSGCALMLTLASSMVVTPIYALLVILGLIPAAMTIAKTSTTYTPVLVRQPATQA